LFFVLYVILNSGKNNRREEIEMSSKNDQSTFVLGVIITLMLSLYLFSEKPTEKEKNNKFQKPTIDSYAQEKLALNYLNKLRQEAGLIAFSSESSLKKASKNHALYLALHKRYGHHEESNLTGFTGVFASQRVQYAGYNTSLIIENVSANNQNYKESIDGLFSAIYHRFAFLDFQADEIGIGIEQNSLSKESTAFVYTIGSNTLNQLYKKDKNPSHKSLETALNTHKDSNKKFITYPFPNQTDIPPAFFDELPDPLPDYDVSGFPISISFNPVHFKDIKLLKFELYNEKMESLETIIHDYKSDPNKRLNKFSFALFPLKRLAWNSHYSVKFLAQIDKEFITKTWSFKTKKTKIPLHIIENNSSAVTITTNSPHLFYFPPQTPRDLLHNVRYNKEFKMGFLDKNTIKLTALNASEETLHLKIGSHDLYLNIKE